MDRSNLISLTLTRLMMVLFLSTCLMLPALSASASKQAFVKINVQNTFLAPGYTFTPRQGIGIVTVFTTPGTPTPSVMWNSSVVQGTINTTLSDPYAPFISSMSAFTLKAGTMRKSWTGAAPSGGSALAAPTATTKCFASVAPVAPGPPALPGACFPRPGVGARTPGAKRYGGTARLLRHNTTIGTAVNFSVGGLDLFNFNRTTTPQGTGPSAVGNYAIRGTGTRSATVLGTARKTMTFDTPNPFTTGVVTAMAPAYSTQITSTGSNNLNPTNVTGTISMVQPFLRNAFNRNQAGAFAGAANNAAAVRRTTFTFIGEVPEPGTVAMLAFGTLGLAGLGTLRRPGRSRLT